MPYLSIQTNRDVAPESGCKLLARASQLIAERLGKPERYVMVALRPPVPMLFGGSEEPAAYLELKSIGLPEEKTAELSAALAALIGESLGIGKDRVYIEFADAPRRMWGYNGATF